MGWRLAVAAPAASAKALGRSRAAGRGCPAVHPAPGERAPRASLFGTDVFGLPDGSALTPDAAPGAVLLGLDPHLAVAPSLARGGAVATALSPDGASLLCSRPVTTASSTSDGERVEAASGEYVFVYDVADGAPREVQVARRAEQLRRASPSRRTERAST